MKVNNSLWKKIPEELNSKEGKVLKINEFLSGNFISKGTKLR